MDTRIGLSVSCCHSTKGSITELGLFVSSILTSVLMGHSTTKTTERHYGRMKTNSALDAIEKEWEGASAKKPLIEIQNNLPGYA
jgi:hypothetical protein